MLRSRILGTGRSVPTTVMTNADLEKIVDTSDAWIVERTGIRERHILEEGRTTSDLATEAAQQACEAAGWDPKTLECVIVATITPDTPMPATAVYVQDKLGCTSSAAFDLSAACAGFIYGMSIADAFIRAGQYRRVCVIGVEVISRVLDWTDRGTCILFGDGAGAVVMGPDESGRGVATTHLYADGSGAQHLLIPGGGARMPATPDTLRERQHYIKMNGRQVYAHAVRNMAVACEEALAANGLTVNDIDLVVAHQANIRILESLAARLSIPMEKVYLNLQHYGNTSSASIPIALDELAREGALRPGDRLLFCAMGAGFAWGSAIVYW